MGVSVSVRTAGMVALRVETDTVAPGRRTFEEAGFRDWWETLPPGHHTIAGTVKLRHDLESPQLGNRRTLWLRLPSSYFDSERRYPLIVMHDGQNLFDEATSFIGQEWRVDETLLGLEPGFEAVVVGIENTGPGRFHEYNPWIDNTRADAYLAFVAETVLPLVRAACHGRVLDDPAQTSIIGSSLGALISLYAFFERRDVFGLCGALSPPTWFGHVVPYLERKAFVGGKLYVDHGKRVRAFRGDNADTGCDGEAVCGTLHRLGYQPGRDLFYHADDGPHSECAWAGRLPTALTLLYDLA